ncbi:MAG: ATP phosphoribosyltransferase regulatory subunit, partial [Candidatus Tectomicrobia bacterium]|nr:ATP phosphoribosyltransferase regulatory subunit [Candidatus Tectomicrobia bacterium]
YYTGVVFEIFDIGKNFRSISGGGRYDNLLDALGGQSLPAVGFGLGDVVLEELLREKGLLPDFTKSLDFYVVWVTEREMETAIKVAQRLRSQGYTAAFSLTTSRIGRMMKEAAGLNAKKVAIIGPDELAQNLVTVRDMAKGEEVKVTLEQLIGQEER